MAIIIKELLNVLRHDSIEIELFINIKIYPYIYITNLYLDLL